MSTSPDVPGLGFRYDEDERWPAPNPAGRPGVFKACVAAQAQYVFDTFGKFPGTVPSVFIMNYVQAHHLDLDFYDRFFKPGAYLRTHAEHMQRWHAGRQGG